MVGWHHWLNQHEFELTPGVGNGQGSLGCCSPLGHKELDTTERLNWTELRSEKTHDTRDLKFYQYVKGSSLLITIVLFEVFYSCSVAQSCQTLCNPMECSMPGFPVLHNLLEFAQTHVHWVVDVIQPSGPLLSPCPHGLQSFLASGSFLNESALFSLIKKLLHFGIRPIYLFPYFTLNILYLYKYTVCKCFALLFHLATFSLN